MELALEPHRVQLLPALDRVHGRIAVGIAVQEEHLAGLRIEREVVDQDVGVQIAAIGVGSIGAVGERVGGIERDRPLDVAGLVVDVVDPRVRRRERGRRAHQRQVAGRRTAHDADAVRIESAARRLRADEADGALEVLPRRHVLGEVRGARRAVLERDDRHALLVEVATRGDDLEAVVVVEAVGAARVDDLDRPRLELLREVPFDEGNDLSILRVGRLAVGPDVFLDVGRAVLVGRPAVERGHLRAERAEKSHLAHELDGAPELGSGRRGVSASGDEVDFGGNLRPVRHRHRTELPVDARRRDGRRYIVVLAVEEAHGAGLAVEREDRVDRRAGREHARRGHRDREVDVAGEVVDVVDLRVRGGLRARRQEEREVRAVRKAHDADLVRAVAALRGGLAHEAHGALPVLPGDLVRGKPGRARAMAEPHARDAVREELRLERLQRGSVADAGVVGTGKDDHARARGGGGRVGPLEVRRRDAGLRVGHSGLRPERLRGACGAGERQQGRQCGDESGEDVFPPMNGVRHGVFSLGVAVGRIPPATATILARATVCPKLHNRVAPVFRPAKRARKRSSGAPRGVRARGGVRHSSTKKCRLPGDIFPGALWQSIPRSAGTSRDPSPPKKKTQKGFPNARAQWLRPA